MMLGPKYQCCRLLLVVCRQENNGARFSWRSRPGPKKYMAAEEISEVPACLVQFTLGDARISARAAKSTNLLCPSLVTYRNHVILTVSLLLVVGLILVNVLKVCLSSPRARFISGMYPGCSLPPPGAFHVPVGHAACQYMPETHRSISRFLFFLRGARAVNIALYSGVVFRAGHSSCPAGGRELRTQARPRQASAATDERRPRQPSRGKHAGFFFFFCDGGASPHTC